MDMSRLTPAGTTTILVHEWVTGGGLAGLPLPASWAAEGHAMRRAIAGDFAAVPGVRVVVTLDDRFDDEPGPWSIVRIGADREVAAFARLVTEVDYTALIAPETGGILADRAATIERVNGRSLGSSSSAIRATTDKLALGRHLAERGIATPECLRVVPGDGLPASFPYPAVLKPIDGAGSQDTYVITGADACPGQARAMPVALLQPMVPGLAMSASFLVGLDGRARLIAAGRQDVEIRDGRLVYRGGTLPIRPDGAEGLARRAAESVPGLRGFVGVDYLWNDAARYATVLEINPRPTTSYVGLARWLSPGTLAEAWLKLVSGAEDGGLSGTSMILPEGARRGPVSFRADGEMTEPDGGVSP
jgi:tyramine---L-glutamate ligase